MPPYAVFIDIDAKSRTIDAVGMAVRGRDRLRGDVLGEREVRECEPPGDIGNDGGGVQRGRASDTGFAGLAGDIDAHAEAVAQLCRAHHGPDAAELNRL